MYGVTALVALIRVDVALLLLFKVSTEKLVLLF